MCSRDEVAVGEQLALDAFACVYSYPKFYQSLKALHSISHPATIVIGHGPGTEYALPQTICETVYTAAAANTAVSIVFSTKDAMTDASTATIAEMSANEKMNAPTDVRAH